MPKMYRAVEVEKMLSEAQDEGASEAGWLSTLADMMTLLLCFFIMLLALAAPDADKYLGTLAEVGAAMGGKSIVELRKEEESAEEKIKKRFKRIIEESNLVHEVELTSDTRGLVIYSRGDMFFKPGSAEIITETKFFLKKVADILKTAEGNIMVEGHTDDVPIRSKMFPTNWELSTARAASVARYLIEEKHMHPKRFIIAGYAEYRPRYMVKPENRSKNRRVEIILMKSKQ